MYPQLKQSGYDRDVEPQWAQDPQWQPQVPYQEVGYHQGSGYADPWNGQHQPQPDMMWPPVASVPNYGQQHFAPPVAAQPAKGRPWRRTLLALTFTFAGGVFARPFLEQHAHALPGDARVVGFELAGYLPDWVQSLVLPLPSASAPAPETRFAGIVTTPLPTPKAAESEPTPVAAVEAAPEQAAPEPESAAVVPLPASAGEPTRLDDVAATHHHRIARDKPRHRSRELAAATPTPTSPAAKAAATVATATAAPSAVAPVVPARKVAPDSLDSLMQRAVLEPDAAPAKAPVVAAPAADDKRSTLSRNQIAEVMKAMTTEVNACGSDLARPTNADLTLTVGPAGDVGAVKVAGPLFATMTAGCIVRTVKAANFPASKGMTFAYRYTLRPGARSSSTALAAPPKPERITASAPTGGSTAAAAPVDRSVLPNLPNRVNVSDDPLSGLNGRAFEGQAQRRGKARK